MNGTGIMFPITDTAIASHRFMPFAVAYGIAPLSSTTGAIDIRKVRKTFPPKLPKKPSTFFSFNRTSVPLFYPNMPN